MENKAKERDAEIGRLGASLDSTRSEFKLTGERLANTETQLSSTKASLTREIADLRQSLDSRNREYQNLVSEKQALVDKLADSSIGSVEMQKKEKRLVKSIKQILRHNM